MQLGQGQAARQHRPILNDDLGTGFEAFLLRRLRQHPVGHQGRGVRLHVISELHTLQRAFTAAGGKWSTFVIWAKHAFTLGRADYQRQYEPILYGWPAGHDRYWCGARDQGDVWFFDKPARNDLHPTMKPVALVERAISNSSKSRDIVLGSVRRFGLDPDRLREDRPSGAAGRARPEVLRRDRAALAGLDRRGGGAGGSRTQLRRDRCRAGGSVNDRDTYALAGGQEIQDAK